MPRSARRLWPGVVHDVTIDQTRQPVHPDLPAVPVWGYGTSGHVTSPGPLLEADAAQLAVVRWHNRLPGSVRPPGDPAHPGAPAASLPFTTARVADPDGRAQNRLGAEGGAPEPTDTAPIGWTSTHLHGAHSRSDSDGWPDNMAATGGEQLCGYDNTYDNADLELDKVGAFLWYHDHAMNGTRYHVYAGLAGGYLVRDQREGELGLPVDVEDGEIVLILADRNVDAGPDGSVRLLHKTTTDTAEFFGPLTLVNGRVWPRLPLRPQVYRLRLLNGSNARAYRLHLVDVQPRGDGTNAVTPVHERLLTIGTDGGLLWRAAEVPGDQGVTLAPAERIDLLLDLTGLPEGADLHLINSAPAPFGGDPAPTAAELEQLWATGAADALNPYPWVLRLDVTDRSPTPGRPRDLFETIATAELNPAFRRLAHGEDGGQPAPGQPTPLPVVGHDHRVILLGETDPPGHLYLQELLEDPDGGIEVQLRPDDQAPTRFRVQGWHPDDPTPSSERVSFYDLVGLRPQLGHWQVWRFVNTTGDTHPIHIHQSTFQPLGATGVRLVFDDQIDDQGNRRNRYDPTTRRTSQPLLVDPTTPARIYDPQETLGWKDVIRVDPGNIVSVAVRFDVPGRYVYHCHVLEHEDTEMMRPLVVTVEPMTDGDGMHM